MRLEEMRAELVGLRNAAHSTLGTIIDDIDDRIARLPGTPYCNPPFDLPATFLGEESSDDQFLNVAREAWRSCPRDLDPTERLRRIVDAVVVAVRSAGVA